MTFLNQTEQIAACIGFILMWAVHLWYSLSYLRLLHEQKRQIDDNKATAISNETAKTVGISIVLPVFNAEDQLAHHLPLLLNQEYERFEIIVVDQNSTDGTLALLEKFEKQYDHLRHTFIPDSARYVSKHNLALTLGIKSAHYEWILIGSADCVPSSSCWLKSMAVFLTSDKDIVFGYTHFALDKTPKKEMFIQFYRQMYSLSWCMDHPAYHASLCNLFYRKSCFIQNNGFASCCNLNYGGEEILVNHQSNHQNTAVCLLPDTFLMREFPGRKQCKQERIFELETAHYLNRKMMYRLRFFVGLLIPWLFYLCFLVGILGSIIGQNWILTGVYFVLTLVLCGIKDKWYHQTSRAFQAGTCHVIFHWFELALPVWLAVAWIKHYFTDKKLFYKKYI